jgi:acetylornithine aminotransferase
LAAAVTDETAMVLLEPVLGEAGVVPPPPGYLAAAREITSAHGTLLAFDEVQTGIGRMGLWYAHHADGVQPDVVTLAKGLGGGLPIGACLAFGAAAALLGPGSHASTFGGNPVCCAAALAVLDTIERDGLLDRAKRLGERLTGAVTGLPGVDHVRGSGLLLGIVLTADVAKAAEAALREAGFLVNACAPGVLRLAPPLILTDEQADSFLAALPAALHHALETVHV